MPSGNNSSTEHGYEFKRNPLLDKIQKLQSQLAEAEKRNTSLNEEISSLRGNLEKALAHIHRMEIFITKTCEKLKGIDNLEPTVNVLKRCLKPEPEALAALKRRVGAEAVCKAVNELEHPDVPLAPSLILSDDLLDFAKRIESGEVDL